MNETEFWTLDSDPRWPLEGALRLDAIRPAISVIRGVEPLGSQFGQSPKKTVPDALYPWIFGQLPLQSGADADHGGQGSFALLDASRASVLPDLLENTDLEWCSLFSGQTAGELRSVAPYLVRLAEGDRFTRSLFSVAGMPNDLWDATPGIFLRSPLSLTDLRSQFRRFTRIQMEDGTWCYFRFWEISALEHATGEAGSELFSRLWRDCRIIWRDDDEDSPTFYLR